MKLSCCSRAFSRGLQTGDLTQLEWIDRCAQLRFDGIEFASSHFPRVDGDYLAQLKKLCVDRGLTACSVVIDPAPDGTASDQTALGIDQWIDRALELGAPIVRVCPRKADGSPGIVWREFVRECKSACAHAKARNVTIALQAGDESLVASPADLKRALKESDSSWLRTALTDVQLRGDAGSDWLDAVDSCVLVVAQDGIGAEPALAALRERGYIGFVSIERLADDGHTAARADALRAQVSGI
jgi:sugar phosphate isomerase/epimerase